MTKEDFLKERVWTVVGDVLNQQKYAFRIRQRLQDAGYEVSAVHPKGGEGVSTSLALLKQKPDVLCLVINPAAAEDFLRQAKALGIIKIWLQPGADTEDILALCRSLGLEFVQACVLKSLA